MSNNESAEISSESSQATATKRWTKTVPARSKVEKMLKESTGLSGIQVDLAQVPGSQYLFHVQKTYYFWNVVTEEGSKVLKPTTFQAIWDQIETDIRKVDVQPLPQIETE